MCQDLNTGTKFFSSSHYLYAGLSQVTWKALFALVT